MKQAKTSRVLSLLALVLATLMLLTLVGCGGDSGKSDKGDKDDPNVSNQPSGTIDGNDPSVDGSQPSESIADSSDPSNSDPSNSEPSNSASANNSKAPSKSQGIVIPKPTGDYKANTKALLKQVPSDLKGQKLKMLIWWPSSQDDKDEAATFKDQTGIQVAYDIAEMKEYQKKLAAQVTAGNPPALAAIINEWFPQPITRDLMQPISATGWDYKDAIYATAMMDQFSYKGKHYGIALKGSNMTTFEVLFFNKELMKKYGVSQDPYKLWKSGKWNWDTCLEIAKKCTNQKQGKFGMTNIYQTFWMLSAGQDFVLSTKAGLKNNITSTALLNSWKQAWKMIYQYKVIPTKFQDQQQLFFDGTVAMLGGGSYFMQGDKNFSYVPQKMQDDWSVVPFPSPKGQAAVAGCEGTVWGFPTGVKGDKLQAAMWYLRYFLDDANCSRRDFYPKDECWEVMGWMWNQKIQSYNSVGVVSYGGKHGSTTIQYDLIDMATTESQIKPNLDKWKGELDTNIKKIEQGL